jgi:hypothetical protein
VSAELAALSVAGMAVHCLAGYSSTGSTTASSLGSAVGGTFGRTSAAAAAAEGGVCLGAGAAVQLPLHAAAAWRLWRLAAAMSELPR